jgi:hypothetical protein
MTVGALDEALARQAEIIAELRAERDDALRRVDRLNGSLASYKQQLEAAQRQRDQLASRLAAMLRIELGKEKDKPRADASPGPSGAASSRGGGASHAGSPPGSARRRPKSAPHKRPVLSDAERDKMVTWLFKKSVDDKKAKIKEIDTKMYGPMYEKRKGKALKGKKAVDENIKSLYTKPIARRKLWEDEMAKKRADQVTDKLKEGREFMELAKQRRTQALEAEGRRIQALEAEGLSIQPVSDPQADYGDEYGY